MFVQMWTQKQSPSVSAVSPFPVSGISGFIIGSQIVPKFGQLSDNSAGFVRNHRSSPEFTGSRYITMSLPSLPSLPFFFWETSELWELWVSALPEVQRLIHRKSVPFTTPMLPSWFFLVSTKRCKGLYRQM